MSDEPQQERTPRRIEVLLTRLQRIETSAIVAKLRAELAVRLPHSGMPLGHIVLKRAEAEQLLRDIDGVNP